MKDLILKEVEAISPEMIASIKKIVQMPSVKGEPTAQAPYGTDILKTLEATLQLCQELGFKTHNLDGHIGWAQYGEGEDYVCCIGHLDVVPVGVGWKHPPFSAYEEDGYIYGRGILDNKGPILCCLYALVALKNLAISLKHPIRIIFGCDEESGFADLKYYLSHEKGPISGWTPDCKYPVVYGERGRATIQIFTTTNHLELLFHFINRYFMNAKTNGESLGVDFTDYEFGTNEMRGYKLFQENGKVGFQVSFAYPAGMSVDWLVQTIKDHAEGLEVALVSHYHPVKFDKNCQMVKSLQDAYETVTGLDGTPVTTTGGTYAKLMPNIVPFGPSFPGQKGIGHLPNEWMKIDDLIANAKIYALALYALGNE